MLWPPNPPVLLVPDLVGTFAFGDGRRGAVFLVGQLRVLVQGAVEVFLPVPDVVQAGQYSRRGG